MVMLAPFDPIRMVSGMGVSDDSGSGPAGEFSVVRAEAQDRSFIITWEVTTHSELDIGDYAVLVFLNGTYVTKVVLQDFYLFTPRADSGQDRIDIVLVPSDEEWSSVCDFPSSCNAVTITFALAGEASSVKIYGNSGATATALLKTLTNRVASIPTSGGSVSGGDAFAEGTWREEATLYDTIDLEITVGGIVGVATYEWTWGEHSGTGTCEGFFDHILNGVRVRFEEDHTFVVGDQWTIRVGFPLSYTTKRFFTNGQHTFKGETTRHSGAATASDPAAFSLNIYNPPAAPTLAAPTYVEASGEIDLVFTAPVNTSLVAYRVFRNFPGTGNEDFHWSSIAEGATSSGATFNVTVTELEAGLNRIMAVVVANYSGHGAMEGAESEAYELRLDASLNSYSIPNAPEAVAAEIDSSGNIDITVWADATSDTINIYTNGGVEGDPVDYVTPEITIVNPQAGVYQEIAGSITSGLSDGLWLIAARAELDGHEEENTTVVTSVRRRVTAAAQMTSFAGEVVCP